MRIPSLTHRGEAQREEEARAEGRAEGRTGVRERPVTRDERPTERLAPVETRREPEPVPEPRGPRARSSMVATFALIVGVVSALAVLTGVLAGYGIVAGAVTVLLAVAGAWTTRRRHVAGRTETMLALVLGLGAVIVGILVVTDSVSWITTTSDKVGELRDWLDTQTVDRF